MPQPPLLEEFQIKLASHFESRHRTKCVTFLLEPDTCAFWNQIRDEQPTAILPPVTQMLTVNFSPLNIHTLSPSDIQFLKTAARTANFHYNGETVSQGLLFSEIPSPAALVGENLTQHWCTPRTWPFPNPFEFTPENNLRGLTAFLNYIDNIQATCTKGKIRQARKITLAMIPHITNHDTIFQEIYRRIFGSIIEFTPTPKLERLNLGSPNNCA